MERYLGEYNLGEGWEATLRCWTILEGRSNFEDLKGGKNTLPKVGRPDLVESWIKSARRPHPEVKAEDIMLFAEDWWGWWKAIQPEWRNTGSVRGPLNASHRVGATGDWNVLDKPDQNGLLSVLACLAWWGETVFESETAEVEAGWQDDW
ncbi:hypothetical protein ARMSODRAFT_894109 [Armillaria solidipes]|uniref:Uncharacterized protein n=1 Tax=Armillaria solidipes TaxID=1076256 RepID=A0A2H3B400_9AGAR|nr:hypothetical protein ARMSODRAFT_894109 [Armillaria solidipes]